MNEPDSDLPTNIVRARPVSRSIQSGGAGTSDRWNLAGVTAWLAAEISPVRFHHDPEREHPGRDHDGTGRWQTEDHWNATPPASIANSSHRRSEFVNAQVWFHHCRIQSPNASE